METKQTKKKQVVQEAYLDRLRQKLEKAKNSYEIAKNDTIEAEGRMVTRYDSTKTETAWLADGYLKDVKELEKCIRDMEQGREFADISDTVFLDLLINTEYQETVSYELSRTGEGKIPENLLVDIVGCFVGDSVFVKDGIRQIEYRLKEIKKKGGDRSVSIGSLVQVEDEYGASFYYITNYFGGIDVDLDGEEVFCISKQTPIAKELLGRKQGERFMVAVNGDMECTIRCFE